MRLPREWRRTSVESFSDDGRYVEYRFVPLFHDTLGVMYLHQLGDPDRVPVRLSISKSLALVQEVARGVYLGDALAMLRLLGQEGRATLIHAEVMWMRGLRGEVSAA
jgi:hypothetical protein